ncbi:MAG TPA: S1 RNA-binding domain-containing protein [Anaerolineales bacterium]|nr:S1 RNA-binding domain-containing protein [Anaerolineales bacterium]
MTDENQALPPQGSDEEKQGEKTNNNKPMTMEALLKEQDIEIDLPQSGQVRKGTIASVSPSQVLVSIGAKSEGVVSSRDLEQLSEEDRDALEVGKEVHVYVISPEDSNGNVVLSLKRAQEQLSWDKVEKALEDNEIIESKIVGFNKGGLIAAVEGLRGFVPASQVSAMRRSMSTGDTPEQRWQKMVGEPISVRVIEVDRERRRLILSEKAASNESRQSIKERVLEELNEGETYTGRVTSIANFGAFININGADGLVHLSEMSWDHIEHPREILEVGEEVDVKVINIDQEKKRIGLSIRALQDDPWMERLEKYSVGDLVEGVITRLTKFGAFARLEGDIEGLIHISEISENRIEHPREVLKEGDVKSLRIIRIEPDQHRIGLSLRKVDSAAFADKDFKILAADFDSLDQSEDVEDVPAVDDDPFAPLTEAPSEPEASSDEAADETPEEPAETAPSSEETPEESSESVESEEETSADAPEETEESAEPSEEESEEELSEPADSEEETPAESPDDDKES